MRLTIEQTPKVDPLGWKRKFAWLPTRVSPTLIIWLESYQRRLVVLDEGTWAGGARYRLDYLFEGNHWAGPEWGD